MSPHRNQYLLAVGTRDQRIGSIAPVPLGSITLYPGPALRWRFARDGDRWLLLLGEALDPQEPTRGNADIAVELLASSGGRPGFLKAIQGLAGRHAIVRGDTQGIVAVGDAMGQRQVYFGNGPHGPVLTSSPRMFYDYVGLAPELCPETRRLVASRAFQRTEQAWYGEEFLDPRLRKVLPNHYLDVSMGTIGRLQPEIPAFPDRSQVLAYACGILRETYRAIAARGRLVQALTAGWDSRLLLAAARHHADRIGFFVFDEPGTRQSADAQVAKRLATTLGLEFQRIERPVLREDFLQGFRREYLAPRVMYTTRHIQHFLDAYAGEPGVINMSGNGGEILRCFYGTGHPGLSARMLADFAGYGDRHPRIANAIARWFASAAPFAQAHGLPLLDLFEWEQNTGNWAALATQELDYAIETISPFSHRGLLLALLTLPPDYRSGPDSALFREMCARLWPEVLRVPVNPHKSRLVSWLRKRTPLHHAVKALRIQVGV